MRVLSGNEWNPGLEAHFVLEGREQKVKRDDNKTTEFEARRQRLQSFCEPRLAQTTAT